MSFKKLSKALNLNKKVEYIYVAGKIRNEDNYRQQFETAKLRLQEHYNVITAAELIDFVEEQHYGEAQEYQIWSLIIEVIEKVDIVFFLDNWVTSPGAKLELNLAKYYEKQIEHETNDVMSKKKDFSGLIKHIQKVFNYPSDWTIHRLQDYMLTKKSLIWVVSRDFELGYLDINKRLGIQFNHASLIHHVKEMDHFVATEKLNKRIFVEEITRLNHVRNIIHAYMEGR